MQAQEFTFTAIEAVKPIAMLSASGETPLKDLDLGAKAEWKRTRHEVTMHEADVVAIHPLDPQAKGKQCEEPTPGSKNVAIVPDTAETIIFRKEGKPLFVSAPLEKIFSGESQGVDIGLVGLVFAASDRAHPNAPVSIVKPDYGKLTS